MNLIDVYHRSSTSAGIESLECSDDDMRLLYKLLAERRPNVNISHRAMPSWEEHVRFVMDEPYEAWYLIDVNDAMVGATYITKQGEIGVHLFDQFKGQGYGPSAVRMLMALHPRGRYLANVSPKNGPSSAMFTKMGFKMIQFTYELRK